MCYNSTIIDKMFPLIPSNRSVEVIGIKYMLDLSSSFDIFVIFFCALQIILQKVYSLVKKNLWKSFLGATTFSVRSMTVAHIERRS